MWVIPMSDETCGACGKDFETVSEVLTHDCPQDEIEDSTEKKTEPDSNYYETEHRLPDDLQGKDREVDPIPADGSVDGGAMSRGLFDKYQVQKNGEPQDGCFVLEPESDPAALEALRTYANETDNLELRSDLRGWIMAIEEDNE